MSAAIGQVTLQATASAVSTAVVKEAEAELDRAVFDGIDMYWDREMWLRHKADRKAVRKELREAAKRTGQKSQAPKEDLVLGFLCLDDGQPISKNTRHALRRDSKRILRVIKIDAGPSAPKT